MLYVTAELLEQVMNSENRKWLLLIHQIPHQHNGLRVKIWRRLQQIGAVAIKQSVYAMPLCAQAREDLSWTLKEIQGGGGEGSIAEAHLMEGLSDAEIQELFQKARGSDYQRLNEEADALRSLWSAGVSDLKDPAIKGAVQIAKLRRKLEETIAIDFFSAPERSTAELRLKELENFLTAQPAPEDTRQERPVDLKGRIWVTRENVFVDRIACGWLIKRFVDENAVYKYVESGAYTPLSNEIRFDMFGGEFTHEGEQCTFEVMVRWLGIQNLAMKRLAEVVHEMDMKDNKYVCDEAIGIKAILSGLATTQPRDDRRMNEGFGIFDNLYAYFQNKYIQHEDEPCPA
jgi:hypothetical protein